MTLDPRPICQPETEEEKKAAAERQFQLHPYCGCGQPWYWFNKICNGCGAANPLNPPWYEKAHSIRSVSVLRRECTSCGALFRVTAQGQLEWCLDGHLGWLQVADYASVPCEIRKYKPAAPKSRLVWIPEALPEVWRLETVAWQEEGLRLQKRLEEDKPGIDKGHLQRRKRWAHESMVVMRERWLKKCCPACGLPHQPPQCVPSPDCWPYPSQVGGVTGEHYCSRCLTKHDFPGTWIGKERFS
jgi:hypothetical protein